MPSNALTLYYIKGLLETVLESGVVGNAPSGLTDDPPETETLESGTQIERPANSTPGQLTSPRPQLSTLALTRLHALLASRGCTQPVLTPLPPGEGLN